MVNLATLT